MWIATGWIKRIVSAAYHAGREVPISIIRTIIALTLASGGTLLQAQAPSGEAAAVVATPEPEQDIVVIGLATPYRIAAGPLRKAQKVYMRGRADAAPASTFYFAVSGTPVEGLVLTLRSRDNVVDLPVDPEGRVVLPDLANGDWTLTANRTQGTMRLQPLVLSPGTTITDRRLGDLRLECAVRWAMAPDVPFPVRAMFDAAGGCRSRRIAFYFRSAQPVVAASVRAADGTVTQLPIRPGGRSYLPPLSDKTLPDTTRVSVRFKS